ncbi:MAG: alkaline phosphatase family protein [Spirochaetes bacterium]|nr:alkaline phosphatase family protein [Spirochaetota bacterium]
MSRNKHPGAGRRLVVVSIDGLSVREWEAVRRLPAFSALMSRGAASRSLRSVFPSLTYVVHTTMMTGRHPGVHGVTHNHPLQPGIPVKSQRWFWYAGQVKAPTLFDLARKAGMKCAAVLWPLVSNARIRWNFPEISALPGESQTLKVFASGSPAYLLDLELRFGKYRRGIEQPWLDGYVSRSAAHTITSRKPDLLMTHLIALDTAKHAAGSDSAPARSALEFLDGALGRIVAAIDQAGLTGETTLAVLGDHGHIDTTRRLRLNQALESAGLCGGSGADFRWRAWCRCSGGSAFLHVRPGDREAGALALDALRSLALDDETGIEAIVEGDALAELHSDRDALCALLARPGTQFVEDRDGPLVEHAPEPGAFGADHGYHPDAPGYRCLFMAAGPGIGPGVELGGIEMVDIAPTLAHSLGFEFPETDGRVIPGLFAD